MLHKIPEDILSVMEKLKRNGYQVVLVGGCLRDLLRGVEPFDWDIGTSATPKDVEMLFPRVIPTGIKFGTVTVIKNSQTVEVTTFREEGVYRDSRHPTTVVFTKDIEKDLLRRDFTVNAMAYDPFQNQLVDIVGGLKDLQMGLIRAVGEPDQRFQEDALRMVRAIRFAGQMGQG